MQRGSAVGTTELGFNVTLPFSVNASSSFATISKNHSSGIANYQAGQAGTYGFLNNTVFIIERGINI